MGMHHACSNLINSDYEIQLLPKIHQSSEITVGMKIEIE